MLIVGFIRFLLGVLFGFAWFLFGFGWSCLVVRVGPAWATRQWRRPAYWAGRSMTICGGAAPHVSDFRPRSSTRVVRLSAPSSGYLSFRRHSLRLRANKALFLHAGSKANRDVRGVWMYPGPRGRPQVWSTRSRRTSASLYRHAPDPRAFALDPWSCPAPGRRLRPIPGLPSPREIIRCFGESSAKWLEAPPPPASLRQCETAGTIRRHAAQGRRP
jgi:hypothetical protein